MRSRASKVSKGDSLTLARRARLAQARSLASAAAERNAKAQAAYAAASEARFQSGFAEAVEFELRRAEWDGVTLSRQAAARRLISRGWGCNTMPPEDVCRESGDASAEAAHLQALAAEAAATAKTVAASRLADLIRSDKESEDRRAALRRRVAATVTFLSSPDPGDRRGCLHLPGAPQLCNTMRVAAAA